VTIDPTTGLTTLLAGVGTSIGSVGGMVGMGSTGYFVTGGPGAVVPGSNRLYQFDMFTGAQTLIGTLSPALTGSGLGGLAQLSVIPSPASITLLLTPAALLILRPRRHGVAIKV
jgi:hypothetical protein